MGNNPTNNGILDWAWAWTGILRTCLPAQARGLLGWSAGDPDSHRRGIPQYELARLEFAAILHIFISVGVQLGCPWHNERCLADQPATHKDRSGSCRYPPTLMLS
jgi:hypothetical protein